MIKVISVVLAGAMLATSVSVVAPALAEEAAAPTTSIQIINDRTMVPLRAISEAFGAIVYWDNDTRTVRVYSDESTVPSDPDEPDADNPEINDPTEPENPDKEEPVNPGDPGTDKPTKPVDPEPPVEEPDNPVVEPEDPEVDTPEEEQPSEEDQQKNVEYNAALLQLQSGYSYDAYYGFKALGDYKDSAELMNHELSPKSWTL